ncbi:MAG TPA: TadG family pilus assembly protein [Tepidisphaeraceae bacterium]|nr:TadG family pilus assembly protein [Tepidisphaeraceae bacterium]
MILYFGVAIVAMFGMISFAVDYARVHAARLELDNAVDAAARYALTGLSDGTTLAKAQTAASANRVDGTPLSLQAADVEVGVWNSTTRVFTVSSTSPNAVRVTGRRTAARGNAVPLMFARVVGQQSCDVTASAVVLGNVGGGDIAGLSSVHLQSNATRIERLSTESGTVNVASNGTWSTNSSAQIAGNVFYRGSLPTAAITGTKTLMSSNLAYPSATAPAIYDADFGSISASGSTTLAAGVYKAHNVSYSGGTISLGGNVDIYISGSCTIGGNTTFYTNSGQYKLRFFMTSSASFTYTSTGTSYMAIYAPDSAVAINDGVVVGSVIANALSMKSGAKLRYSSLLPPPLDPSSGGIDESSGSVRQRSS